MIVDVVNALCARIEDIYGVVPIVVNEVPAVFKEGQFLVIYPSSMDITQTVCIGSGSWEEFVVRVVYVAHEADMNRQKTIVQNIELGMNKGYDILTTILPRGIPTNKLVAEYNAYKTILGTDTWEANSRIYTCLTMKILFKGVLYN